MAASAERLRAHQLRLLARCQEAREVRRRTEMTEARAARESAAASRDAADAALLQAAQDRVDQLRARYDAMAAGPTDFNAIAGMRKAEQDLTKAQNRQADKLKQAEGALAASNDAVAVAEQAYAAASQLTRKRDQMAARAQRSWRQAASLAEESALEEELGDRLAVRPALDRA